MTVVSNSSPLIAFDTIGESRLLPAIFGSVLIPPAVAREIAPSFATLPPWLVVHGLSAALPPAVRRGSLGDGEREALALALEIQAERILLDDRAARRVGQELNLHITRNSGNPACREASRVDSTHSTILGPTHGEVVLRLT